jgi:hypothetical protein
MSAPLSIRSFAHFIWCGLTVPAVAPRTFCRASKLLNSSLTGRSIIVYAFPRRRPLLVQTMPASGDKDLGMSAKSLANSAKAGRIMTDVSMAASIMQDAFPVGPGRNVGTAIGEIFSALKAHERSLPRNVLRERNRQWTERRVRALWKKEARRVDHYEIQDLTAVAVEEARRERQHLEARQERLAALIASFDPSEVGEVADEASAGILSVDLSRTGFTEADERADQSRGWGR